VGITSEVLPIIMTITLSNGALRRAKEKVITKGLVSVEDFGNIDTLCCDKTGTLTEEELSLHDYLGLDERREDKLILYGLLCSSVEGGKGKKSFGNPMEKAIWENKKAKEIEAEVENYTIINRNEFDFERRRMSVLVKGDKSNILIVKGVPESILGVSDFAMVGGKETELSSDLVSAIKDKIAGYENDGYRVIALAERYTDQAETTKDDEKNLIITGFFLFLDPPKKTVGESLNILRRLGVSIKVISGDSPIITRKVCNDVGLLLVENKVVTGDELEQLDDDEFETYSMEYNVFARATPEQKYRIVLDLNREGHIVGFLGDGINDAPALRAADVGISVDTAAGIAKEAADIILLKKNLRVLAHGIIAGRKAFGNITKYILNTISTNYGNMITVAMSSLFLKFIPLLPSQILLNNFITDAPFLTISTDNVDREFLKRPKRWKIGFISRFMVYFGLISTFLTWRLFYLSYS
jgi:Mg2+-importing ATPase